MIPSIQNTFIQEPLTLKEMPNEILKGILDAIYDPSKGDIDNLRALGKGFISKALSERVIEVKNDWINHKGLNLNFLGNKTAAEAVQYIIRHRLIRANLSSFEGRSLDRIEFARSANKNVMVRGIKMGCN